VLYSLLYCGRVEAQTPLIASHPSRMLAPIVVILCWVDYRFAKVGPRVVCWLMGCRLQKHRRHG
jgi:hypothetical protein